MSFIVLVTALVFTSCSKETIILSETDNLQTVIDQDTDFDAATVYHITKSTDNEAMKKSRITIILEATVTSASPAANEYFVDFSVNHDCTKSEVVADQTLDFSDAVGKLVSLTFRVNSYTASNGALQLVFDLGGHNLSGLALKTAQEIVIEEILIN
ncbi:MAG: hypothetical protein ACI85O_002933 [Saprospiraceae bacterium]|jgi:hypothetical protein